MRAMIRHVGLEIEDAQKYWCECMNILVKTESILTNKNENKCAYEKFEGRMSRYIQFLSQNLLLPINLTSFGMLTFF